MATKPRCKAGWEDALSELFFDARASVLFKHKTLGPVLRKAKVSQAELYKAMHKGTSRNFYSIHDKIQKVCPRKARWP